VNHPTGTASAHRGTSGFTLIELMITVAVIAILATIAVPSYRVYVERANRTVAKTAMVDVVSRQNSHYVDRKRFATTLTKLGLGADTLYLGREGTLSASNGDDSIYEVTLAGNANNTACPATSSATASGFTVVARPIHSQVSDTRCATMCLSSSGIKSASGTDAGNCWTR
jgi:type IV pilus assembly protein PilE